MSKLKNEHDIDDDSLRFLLENQDIESVLFSEADVVRREHYGDDVYIRGLIEISNYCKNNCYYCGIRRDNKNIARYRLTKSDILECCDAGYLLGFRTFVMQGGEDGGFDDNEICDIVSSVKSKYPDCAITLSIGEKSKESYKAYFDAGADRYLLRHETACDDHYQQLHPQSMSLKNRKKCLYNLKEIGYQVGAGFMVGSPFQTIDNIIADLRFLQELQPDMVGIGPFIRHHDTPFKDFANGDLHLTLRIIAIVRLMLPYALIPSTTALGTISNDGRELGLKAGANVVMPNLSPSAVRSLYSLYDNKKHSGSEAAESLNLLKKQVEHAGYRVVTDVGNVKR
ncbi:MAG: [FeFe] hydrogenase H-cluster radical SAM maturase HydE [Clostridia bacterium]|nr:[FeFe] hydrogenase H-cluster radical SAM maturase HydE [Clostridia bacterium]